MAGDFDCCIEPINRQERPMTSPTQRRHDEILARLDALTDAVQSTTARDHLHRLLAEESAAERRDEPVDTAPDVDPDEALAEVLAAAARHEPWPPNADSFLNLARAALEHIYAEPDQSWVTRDLDEAEQRAIDAEARATQAEAARDREANRYEALRADVTAHAHHHAHNQSGLAFDCFATILEDDDKRGRDA